MQTLERHPASVRPGSRSSRRSSATTRRINLLRAKVAQNLHTLELEWMTCQTIDRAVMIHVLGFDQMAPRWEKDRVERALRAGRQPKEPAGSNDVQMLISMGVLPASHRIGGRAVFDTAALLDALNKFVKGKA